MLSGAAHRTAGQTVINPTVRPRRDTTTHTQLQPGARGTSARAVDGGLRPSPQASCQTLDIQSTPRH